MEGLIKGLAKAAIDHFDKRNDDGDDDNADRNPSRDRDEQSRSSWAQVVSGDDDQNKEDESRRDQGRHAYNKPTRHQVEDQSDEGRNAWQKNPQTQGSSQPTRYQRDDQSYDGGNAWQKNPQPQGSSQEAVENNDGWETVQKKPSRRHQKVHMDHWNGYKCAPEEQAYADEVNIGNDTRPSQVELGDLSEACNKLWELDLNRLVPGRDYEVDVGDGKKVYDKRDQAEGCLLRWVSEDVFRKPTFSRFCSLLDNYNPNAGYKEVVTNEEKQEEAAFIEEISRTAPIKYLYSYLSAKGDINESYNEFKRTLTNLWFGLYSRCGTSGSSSAFEHVFVGEIKQQGEEQVTGFHNWLQFYLEEAKGNVDYQGYIFPRRRGEIPDSETQLLTIQFEWNGVLKSMSSTLIGVSPEFEMALYTLCFFAGREDNRVQLGPYSVNVKCYHNGNKLGSAFPIAES